MVIPPNLLYSGFIDRFLLPLKQAESIHSTARIRISALLLGFSTEKLNLEENFQYISP
jgi:hypothetical protein